MTPEQMIESKSGTDFRQNHPVLDTLDFGDVRDLMEDFARQEAMEFERWKVKNGWKYVRSTDIRVPDFYRQSRLVSAEPLRETLEELYDKWRAER